MLAVVTSMRILQHMLHTMCQQTMAVTYLHFAELSALKKVGGTLHTQAMHRHAALAICSRNHRILDYGKQLVVRLVSIKPGRVSRSLVRVCH